MLDGPQMDPRELRNAFGCFATGVTVISLLDDRAQPTGVTVSSFSSLSLSPALCLFSLDRDQVSCRWIDRGNGFNVNVLSAQQDAVAWQFAKPAEDKFADVDWFEGRNGLPVIAGSLSHFECRKWDVYDGGDHLIVVGEITHFDKRDGQPLVFYRGKMESLAE